MERRGERENEKADRVRERIEEEGVEIKNNKSQKNRELKRKERQKGIEKSTQISINLKGIQFPFPLCILSFVILSSQKMPNQFLTKMQRSR